MAKEKQIYILPDPWGDKIQYWIVDDNLFAALHPVVTIFFELTQYTCPHPHEPAVYGKYFEEYIGCQRDTIGNYFLWIDNPDGTKPTTMFTSHLDTADKNIKKVNHRCYSRINQRTNEETYICETDGTSILGADCKAGTALQLWMINHQIPGLYYFFLGEEVGLIGSRALAKEWKKHPEYKDISRCVSFDRMRNHSIISKQSGKICCSPEFVDALIKEFKKSDIPMESDPGGSATDSLAFIEIIPECTNLSVGYKYQHQKSEEQDLTFLGKLADAVLLIDWENLPVKRDPTPPVYTPASYNSKSYYGGYNQNSSHYDERDDYGSWWGGSESYSATKTFKPTTNTKNDSFEDQLLERVPYVLDFTEIKSIIEAKPLKFINVLLKSLNIKEEEAIDKMIKYLVSKVNI